MTVPLPFTMRGDTAAICEDDSCMLPTAEQVFESEGLDSNERVPADPTDGAPSTHSDVD